MLQNRKIVINAITCVLPAYLYFHLHKVWASSFLVRKITLMTPESTRSSMHGLFRLCPASTIPHTPRHPAVSYMSSFFKRPHPSSAPYSVYSSGLADLHEGHALWRPEPHASTGEPQIGDVGYMSEGAFIRLFSLNPSLEPEQQVTFWSRPFKPTALLDPEVFRELDRREALRPGHYTSHNVHRLSLSGSFDV